MSKSGIIYKLCCNDTDITEEYVGSTKNFNRRKAEHKTNCNNEKYNKYGFYVYQFIRSNGGFNNWIMIQLESVNYETKRDLEAHERRWIELLKPRLNKNIPTRTKKEWGKDNKDKIQKQKKEYIKQNKDKIFDQKKEYIEKNKDKIQKQKKNFYEQNKDKILEQHKHKVKCIYCDSEIRNTGLTRHNKTEKHIYNYIYY